MEKTDESKRYKWTASATNLLVSIWSHDMVQNRLKFAARNQAIWDSIARFMVRKGFNVNGSQCRTRIKNMLCNYNEAIRKRDPSYIEPYFELFKKVVKNRMTKKKVKKTMNAEREEGELDIELNSDQQFDNQNDSSCDINYAGDSSQEDRESPVMGNDLLGSLEKIIMKAVETQTKVISQALKFHSDLIEKLLVAEREKIERILASENESRKRLEERLDRLLSRIELTTVPQLTYMAPLIETQQSEVLSMNEN